MALFILENMDKFIHIAKVLTLLNGSLSIFVAATLVAECISRRLKSPLHEAAFCKN